MIGPIEVGQRWQHRDGGLPVTVHAEAFARDFVPAKPTIPLRIRVGVTADGTWLAGGSNQDDFIREEDTRDAAFSATLRTPVVAWHWITAEVPMPETEHGDVAGEVER